MRNNHFWRLLCVLLIMPHFNHAQPLLVTSNQDDGPGTLRQAIMEANRIPGPDSIFFAIPGQEDSEAGFVSLSSPLPAIADAGLYLAGGVAELSADVAYPIPYIVLAANELFPDSAAVFDIRSEEVHIRNVMIINAAGGGISFKDAHSCSISGCYIGLQQGDDGADRDLVGGDCIRLVSSNQIFIGPSEDAGGNVISGYKGHGVGIMDSSAWNVVLGNYIGLSPRETKNFRDGNEGAGILIGDGCHHNEVFDNHIGYHGVAGIQISGAKENAVFHNRIGMRYEFIDSFPNLGHGISILNGSTDNQIVENAIGSNQGFGIWCSGINTRGNLYSRNSISRNAMGGIHHESGANRGIMAPSIDRLQGGTISGSTGSVYVLEFFFDFGAQGQIYIDSVVAGTDGSFSLLLPEIPEELNLTATARDQEHNTSVFSEPFTLRSSNQALIVQHTGSTGEGSLHAAIELANQNPGPDTILFNLNTSDPGYVADEGVWYFTPDTPFALITDVMLVIDGTSQSAFSGKDTNPNGPEIVIDGTELGSAYTCFNVRSPGFELYEITIQGFGGVGVNLYTSESVVISGCYIGTSSDGMQAVGNNDGIVVGGGSQGIHIGPSLQCNEGNLISGNRRIGVFLVDSARYNVVVGNRIGVNREASEALGNNQRGIDMERAANANEIFDNMIGGNGEGIGIFSSDNNIIGNNWIGTDRSETLDLGNSGSGIYLQLGSEGNQIFGNTIANNQAYGIYNDGDTTVGNRFSRNQFIGNNLRDIVNVNGGNLDIAPPVITGINGRVVSGTGAIRNVIELYLRDTKGRVWFADSTKVSDGGSFAISLEDIPSDVELLALSIDDQGNTSEFSEPFSTTTANEKFEKVESFNLYAAPNPASDQIILGYHITKKSLVQLSITDALGRQQVILDERLVWPGTYQFDRSIQELDPGIYFISLWVDHQPTRSLRLLVIR